MRAGPTAALRRHVTVLAALLACLPRVSAPGPIDPAAALRVSQAAIGRQVGDYRLTDQFGRTLQLVNLRGRPLVISFIYTSCAFVCPILTTRLAKAAKVGREALGSDSFSLLSVGFDTRVDTPQQLRRYAKARGIDLPGWYFAAADRATVDRLATDTGFVYAPVAGGFDHFAQITIVDASGRVYRQIYGPEFEPPAIVDPLKTLVLGVPSGARPVADWLNKVRLICTAYDPRSGRYRFDYSLILELAIGVLCTVGVGIFVVRAWGQSRGPDVAS